MTAAIITQLKTGSYTTVVPYGSARPAPPYVVVRPEQDGLGRGRVYRIILHMEPGQQAWLEDYIFNEVLTLLDGLKPTTRHGNDSWLLALNEWTDIVVSNDDGTISMERRFLQPSRTF